MLSAIKDNKRIMFGLLSFVNGSVYIYTTDTFFDKTTL